MSGQPLDIQKFALSDDEIPYELLNEIPEGDIPTALQNVPIQEVSRDPSESMRYRLISGIEGRPEILLPGTSSPVYVPQKPDAVEIQPRTFVGDQLTDLDQEWGYAARVLIDPSVTEDLSNLEIERAPGFDASQPPPTAPMAYDADGRFLPDIEVHGRAFSLSWNDGGSSFPSGKNIWLTLIGNETGVAQRISLSSRPSS